MYALASTHVSILDAPYVLSSLVHEVQIGRPSLSPRSSTSGKLLLALAKQEGGNGTERGEELVDGGGG